MRSVHLVQSGEKQASVFCMALFCLFKTKLVSSWDGGNEEGPLSRTEASAWPRQPLRAPGAHVAGQKERKPAPLLELSVRFVGAS